MTDAKLYQIEYGYMGSGEEVAEKQLDAYHQIEALKKAGFLKVAKSSRYWMALGEDDFEETIYSQELGCELIAVEAVMGGGG